MVAYTQKHLIHGVYTCGIHAIIWALTNIDSVSRNNYCPRAMLALEEMLFKIVTANVKFGRLRTINFSDAF